MPEVAGADTSCAFWRCRRWRDGWVADVRWLCFFTHLVVTGVPSSLATVVPFVVSSEDYHHDIGDMVRYPFLSAFGVVDFVIVPIRLRGTGGQRAGPRMVVMNGFGDKVGGLRVP